MGCVPFLLTPAGGGSALGGDWALGRASGYRGIVWHGGRLTGMRAGVACTEVGLGGMVETGGAAGGDVEVGRAGDAVEGEGGGDGGLESG